MPIIEAENLTKHFRVAVKQPGVWGTLKHTFKRKHRIVEAVKAVSFTIEPGEIVGFLGPNGAGKTTTLKMLTGLIHPTGGKATVTEHVPFRRDAAFLKRITLVMGNKQQLLWDLPAMDALRVNAAVYEIADDVFKQRVDELVEMLELSDLLYQPVRKLSLGERMKTELLAALLHQPDVLFLDEPTLGLDVNAQTAVRRFLRDYNQTHGATILLTSHYMADITALCPRVMMIHHGEMIHDGSLTGVIERFAPYRELMLDLEEPTDRDVIAQYGEVVSVDQQIAKLLVQRDVLKPTVQRVMEELPITDLTITDPPIEDVIARVFSTGIVTEDSPYPEEVAAGHDR
ncbi:MAG: ABC transporter [Planctomycetaceae bacterium]|nr:ABC transporter [Planctomycetaceae bacterium]